jgi:hypothetical protein
VLAGSAPSGGSGGESGWCLTRASVIASSLWLVDTPICLHFHMASSPHVSVSSFFFFFLLSLIKIPVIGWGPILIQDDVILRSLL